MKGGFPRVLVWGLSLWLLCLAIAHLNHVLQHPYPIEYGEGVNVLWAQRAAQAQALYPQISDTSLPQLHNPYPPLFPLLTALTQQLKAPAHPFYAGRLLSLLGLALSLHALFAWIRSRSTFRNAILFSILFLTSPMLLQFAPMMRVDMLALGCALQALLSLDKGRNKTAAFWAALAFCIKPSYCAAAATVATTVLLQKNKKNILLTALCGSLLPIILGAWVYLQPQNIPTQHLLTLQGLPPDFSGLFQWLSRFLGQHAPILALGILYFNLNDGILKRYAIFALIPFLLTAWISGSQANYLLELWAAACMSAAVAWPALRESHPRSAWLLLALQLLLFIPIAPAPVFTRTYGQEVAASQQAMLSPSKADKEIGDLITAELSALPAPILSADLGYLQTASQQALYQPYQFEKLSASQQWSPKALHQAIQTETFSAILLKGLAEENADPTFNPDTQQLIHQHYSLHRVLGPWHLYRR